MEASPILYARTALFLPSQGEVRWGSLSTLVELGRLPPPGLPLAGGGAMGLTPVGTPTTAMFLPLSGGG